MGAVSADAFLLPVGSGFRFCLLRLPARRAALRGCVLLAPPFAEELNKARRMIALAAERIAAADYAVLEIDYLGCGDSSSADQAEQGGSPSARARHALHAGDHAQRQHTALQARKGR